MGDNIVENNITPTDFYKKYVDLDLKNDFVAIINAPTSDKKFNERYLIKSLGNVIGGDSVCYYNLDIERIKELTIKQLTDGKPVWFGCDSRNYVDREKGILDLKVSDYSLITGFHDEIDKGMALQSGISSMNHAMVFRGVNIKNGKSDRWFVENSYGKQAGKDGCLMMTDKWFERFVYEVVIEKKYLNDSEMFNLKREPIGLEIWDSIGTLAD
jgi:bleomycin hydrolase